MPKRMITRSIQFRPGEWEIIQDIAERKDMSASNFVRECVSDCLDRITMADLESRSLITKMIKKLEEEKKGSE